MATYRAVLASGAVALTLALAACSGQPGTAAVVDDRTISQADVTAVHGELAEVFPGIVPSGVLRDMILAPVVLDAAAEQGVVISDADAQTAVDDFLTSSGGTAVPLSDDALQLIRSDLALQTLSGLGPEAAADLVATAQALEVEVNPRYGAEFDLEQGGITPLSTPWVGQPAAS